jgi:hypothetical protein
MFNTNVSHLNSVIVHYVGNQTHGDELLLSQNLSGLDETTIRVLWAYVASAFKVPDFYRFTHPVELEMNSVYAIAQSIFNNPESLVEQSQSLAKLLYEASQHPQVKSGELIVMYFENIRCGELEAPAIGLFKSERKSPFLFTEEENSIIDLYSYRGIDPAKVDKACLIFNEDAADGYHVLSVDNLNKGEETKFWFDNFLQLQSRSTEYSKTSSLISMTKHFIDMDLNEDGEMGREEQIDLLNRSKEYFKENDQFVYEDFGEQVFEDRNMGHQFREYATNHAPPDVPMDDGFEISKQAFQKQQRIFKSVLKLDRNFHIYIHGNRNMIEKGTDENGRKYYKLYYDEEH